MCNAIANVQVNGARPENSFMANKSAIRSLPRLVCFISVIILCLQTIPLQAADSRHFAIVPALGVLAGGQIGTVHYVVLQINTDSRQMGPTVQMKLPAASYGEYSSSMK